MTESADNLGVIYLLHFDEPYQHARHYLGFCTSYEGLDSRFEFHANGRGSHLLAAVTKAGIKWRLVRLWKGTRNDERHFKYNGASTPFCPICRPRPRMRKDLEEIPV